MDTTTTARYVGAFIMHDPNYRPGDAPVALCAFKHEGGGLFAIDASYLAGGHPRLTDPDDEDSDPAIPDPFGDGDGVCLVRLMGL